MAGTVVSTFVSIVWAWVAFYGLLFTSQSLDRTKQYFFLNCLSLKLSGAEQSLCEGELTEGECKRALDTTATGKSPALDGLQPSSLNIFGRFLELILSTSLMLLIFMHNCLPRSELGLSRSSLSVGIVLT